MTYAEHSGHYDAVFFYVNHKYEEFAGLPAKAMLGHTVRDADSQITVNYASKSGVAGILQSLLSGQASEGED